MSQQPISVEDIKDDATKWIYLQQIKAQKILLQKTVIKLHIGCGTNYFDGWVNIDNNSDNNISKLDIAWDLRNALPFPDASVDFIFNEHFFEHLNPQEGQLAVQDFLRVLKPGGVFRIAMPDLEDAVRAYLSPNWKKDVQPFLRRFGLGFVKTRAELLNMSFSWWGHKWQYDWEELERRLKEAGAVHITRCQRLKSAHSELQNLETRLESGLIAEVCKP